MILAFNSLKCKHSLLKEKFKVKSQTIKLQIERISILEEIIEYLHNSYTKIIKHTRMLEHQHWQYEGASAKFVRPIERRATHITVPNIFAKSLSSEYDPTSGEILKIWDAEVQVYIQSNYNKELKAGIEASKNEIKSYKDVIGNLTDQLKQFHDIHQRKMKGIMMEYKNNCQDELKRRQEEINKLHEVLSHWMHQCMELQEKFGIPSSNGNPMHRRSLSKQYINMIKQLCEKTELVYKGKKAPLIQNLGNLDGDKSPPLYAE